MQDKFPLVDAWIADRDRCYRGLTARQQNVAQQQPGHGWDQYPLSEGREGHHYHQHQQQQAHQGIRAAPSLQYHHHQLPGMGLSRQRADLIAAAPVAGDAADIEGAVATSGSDGGNLSGDMSRDLYEDWKTDDGEGEEQDMDADFDVQSHTDTNTNANDRDNPVFNSNSNDRVNAAVNTNSNTTNDGFVTSGNAQYHFRSHDPGSSIQEIDGTFYIDRRRAIELIATLQVMILDLED